MLASGQTRSRTSGEKMRSWRARGVGTGAPTPGAASRRGHAAGPGAENYGPQHAPRSGARHAPARGGAAGRKPRPRWRRAALRLGGGAAAQRGVGGQSAGGEWRCRALVVRSAGRGARPGRGGSAAGMVREAGGGSAQPCGARPARGAPQAWRRRGAAVARGGG